MGGVRKLRCGGSAGGTAGTSQSVLIAAVEQHITAAITDIYVLSLTSNQQISWRHRGHNITTRALVKTFVDSSPAPFQTQYRRTAKRAMPSLGSAVMEFS